MHVAQETLGLRRPGLSPGLSLLMSAFALPILPACLTARLHRPTERSPTIHRLHQKHSHCRLRSTAANAERLDFDGGIAAGAAAPASSPPPASALGGACESAISVSSLSPVTSSA